MISMNVDYRKLENFDILRSKVIDCILKNSKIEDRQITRGINDKDIK